MVICKLCGAEFDEDEMTSEDICLNCANNLMHDDAEFL